MHASTFYGKDRQRTMQKMYINMFDKKTEPVTASLSQRRRHSKINNKAPGSGEELKRIFGE